MGAEAIEPNYAEQDVDSLLGIAMEVQIRSGLELFDLMGTQMRLKSSPRLRSVLIVDRYEIEAHDGKEGSGSELDETSRSAPRHYQEVC